MILTKLLHKILQELLNHILNMNNFPHPTKISIHLKRGHHWPLVAYLGCPIFVPVALCVPDKDFSFLSAHSLSSVSARQRSAFNRDESNWFD